MSENNTGLYPAGTVYVTFAWLFVAAATILAIAGLRKAFGDSSYVGGDAYNYIIAAGRGAVLMGAAILLGILAAMLAIFAARAAGIASAGEKKED